MGALTDLSDVINRGTGGSSGTPQLRFWIKGPRVNGAAAAATIAGRYTSLWRYEGNPSHGSTPGTTALIPTNTTAGGILQDDSSGGRDLWLTSISGVANTPGTILLYDRLLHVSGLSGTSVSAQTVGGTLTRYTSTAAKGNLAFVEINTQIGATSRTASVIYESDTGATSQTSPSFVIGNTGYREAERLISIPLLSGHAGFAGITSITLSATTGTAGDFGVIIARPIGLIPVTAAGIGQCIDFITGFPVTPKISADACLVPMWIANSTTAPDLVLNLNFIEA